MALARECGRTKVHLGNPRKRRGFSGVPIAASCGGNLHPKAASPERSPRHSWLMAKWMKTLGRVFPYCIVEAGCFFRGHLHASPS